VIRAVVGAAAARAAVVVGATGGSGVVRAADVTTAMAVTVLVGRGGRRRLVRGLADVAGGIVAALTGLRACGQCDGRDGGGGEDGLGKSVTHGGLQ
jgi:hypothetical protein